MTCWSPRRQASARPAGGAEIAEEIARRSGEGAQGEQIGASGCVEKASDGGAATDPAQAQGEPQQEYDAHGNDDQGDRGQGGQLADGVLQRLSGVREPGAGVGCGLERLLQEVADKRHVRDGVAGVVEGGGETFAGALHPAPRLGQQHDRVVDGQGELHRGGDQDHGDQVREDLAGAPCWGLGVEKHRLLPFRSWRRGGPAPSQR